MYQDRHQTSEILTDPRISIGVCRQIKPAHVVVSAAIVHSEVPFTNKTSSNPDSSISVARWTAQYLVMVSAVLVHSSDLFNDEI
jgi:hypothetical protein